MSSIKGRPNVAVIIPAFNEAPSIGMVLADIPRSLDAQIILVDNNSTDATARVAQDHGATVVQEPRQGYGSACMRGVQHLASSPKKPDIVVFLDADYSDYPAEMISLIEPIFDENFDLVLGSRSMGKMEQGAMPAQQLLGNRLAVWMIKALHGAEFTDLGPFRAIKFDRLLELDMQDRSYGWPVEMQVKAVKRHLRVCEVPVSYRPRVGRSKISGTIRGTFMAGYRIIDTILRYR